MKQMGRCCSTSVRLKRKVRYITLLPTNPKLKFICEHLDWEETYTNLRETLGLPSDDPIPKLPRPDSSRSSLPVAPPSKHTKRKTADEDGDADMAPPDDDATTKRSKTDTPATTTNNSKSTDSDQTYLHAQAAAAYIPFLDTENLLPPKMPTREEMEGVLLALRKQALVEEYFGEAEAQ